MTAAKRDAEVYVGRAEQAKAIGKMEERRAAAAAAKAAADGGGSEGAAGGGLGGKRKREAGAGAGGDARAAAEAVVRRQFRQRQPLPDRLMGTHRPPPVDAAAPGGGAQG